ncbi:MAG TPA: hypothetical protein VHA56_16135 [Mucilaginibacter sp.]|nr:hypothetical protein [Mucilaginibacter sp.]
MEIITLNDALKLMEAGSFDITVITCDLNRNKGGRRVNFRNARLSTPSGKGYYNFRNNTRTIISPGMDHPESIHPILMTHINGKEVSL